MLVALLSSQYMRFVALAEAWLAMGATSFGVWKDERPLAHWPTGSKLRQASLIVPLEVDDKIVGELRVSGLNSLAARSRLEADASLLSHLIKLEEELQSMTSELMNSQDQLLALYRLTESMSRHVSIDETLNSLVFEAVRLLRVQSGFAIFVPLSKDQEPAIVQHHAHSIDESIIWRCFWEAHAVDQETILTTTNPDGVETDYDSNVLFLPIRTRGTVTAGLGLLQPPGVAFSGPDIKLARAIADQASMQVEKVLLYQESLDQARFRTEMELARRVQIDLLPRQLPQVAGLDIYAYSRPASHVGGDFYDAIYEPDRPFIFTIGDVSGKGLSAALLMTMTRSAIHSKAHFMPQPTPELILKQASEDLYEDFTQVGMFATVFVGQYDPHNRTLYYVNAGHSPVIHRPYDAPARMLVADSTPLGVLPDSVCKNQQISLRPGDLLIAATDGFNDARNSRDESFGYERLLKLADELATESAQDITKTFFDVVDRFRSGFPQEDDQTLFVIKGVSV